MVNHIKNVHEGKRSYKCELCTACFSDNHRLKSHVKSIHYGSWHHCSKCNYKNALKKKVENHMALVHEGIRKYKCDICEVNYRECRDLSRHISLPICFLLK